VNKYRQKSKPRGRENVAALQKAENDAQRMRGSRDGDLSRMGQAIENIVRKLLAARKEKQAEQEIKNQGSKKRFYTSADASAKDD
jgi:hypothetical protein